MSKVIDEGQYLSVGVEDVVKSRCDENSMATRRKNHGDGKLTSSGQESEFRERKKSRYLCFPYVHGKQDNVISSSAKPNEMYDSKNLSLGSAKSTPLSTLTRKSSQKKGPKYSYKEHKISNDNYADVCSTELLTELHSFALDHSCRSKYPNLVKQFYHSFRAFAFLDLVLAHEILKGQRRQTGAKTKVRKKRKGKTKELLAKIKEEKRMEESGQDQGIKGASVAENASTKGRKDLSEKIIEKENMEEFGQDPGINSAPVVENTKEPLKGNQQENGSGEHVKARKQKEEVLFSVGTEPTGNLFHAGDSTAVDNSSVISFQGLSPDSPKENHPKKREKETATPLLFQFEAAATLPNLNGDISSISCENIPIEMSVKQQGVESVIGSLRPLSSEYTATESTSNLIHNATDSSFNNSLQSILLPSNSKPVRKKSKGNDKTSQVASVIPDLNGTTVDFQSLEKFPAVEDASPAGDQPKKKRRISHPNEDFGAMLLLNFAQEHPVPSKETLVAAFSRFGLLQESETQFLDNSSVHIFYGRTSDALFAIRSLEKYNPFGESLVSFKFHSLESASTTAMEDPKALHQTQTFSPVDTTKNPPSENDETPYITPIQQNIQMMETTMKNTASTTGNKHRKLCFSQPFSPVDTTKNSPSKKGDNRNLTFIKKNVEMMKMTLEKAGDNISQEMRAKLENEIKGFLNKIASMDSGSSC